MKIERITNQHRRDFQAEMKCEFCNTKSLLKTGYDDRYYHDVVIPNMKCSSCGKSTVSEKGIIDFRETKYPEDAVI